MKSIVALCALAVSVFFVASKAVCDSASQDPEQPETGDWQARDDAETLRQRYEQLGKRIEEERARIAQRNPEFDIAGFIREVEHSTKPAFEHARVTAPQRRQVGGRYMQARIKVTYVDKSLVGILEYLRAIENHEADVAISAIELSAGDEEEAASFEMRITLLAVTELPEEAGGKQGDDLAAENSALPDEAVELEALKRLVDERIAELAALSGEGPRPVLDVLRELSRASRGGKLTADKADEPVELAADMLAFIEPVDPWALRISGFQMDRARVEIVGSAADYRSVNEFRRALEESPAFRNVTIRGTRVVEDRRTELRIWLRVEEPPELE